VQAGTPVTTFLFTDIEGSSRLWEEQQERMRPALARHDQLARQAVAEHHGTLIKMTGDGLHAAFADPLDALSAAVQLQLALAELETTQGVALRARCGLHAGVGEQRDNDFFGREVNRAARIMGAAHGGQVLLSQALAALMRDRLPVGVALRDLGAVRLRGLATPEQLYQLQHPQLRADFPALRELEVTPNNLPQQVSSFVGRERVLDEVGKLLQSTRLLTLFGAGGIGKTRLSLQAAGNVLDRHPDGVWFVELAPLSDPRLVAQAVASTLGVKEERGRPVIEAVLHHVRERSLLIVLDNCEHLVAACAEVAHLLLGAGPQVRILATSREPLHVAGEVTYPVPPLPIPDPGADTVPERLLRFESVRLFVDRAAAVLPRFAVTEASAPQVADICRRLDGIPLALELAAACIRSMSVERIALRLGDRFRLLSGGDRTALPRQQTLRAMIDWSYDLLDDGERVLLRRLAVFAGGFTVEAAEAVGSDDQLSERDVLDLLARLVDKSLVVLDAGGERYRLLDTLRDYAWQRLDAVGETAAIRTRHRDYFLARVERIFPELFGEQQVLWLAHLDGELDNILAAHAWCGQDSDGGPRDLRLVHAVKPYYYNRGLLGLALRITSEALEHRGSTERDFLRCVGLFDAGQLHSFMGQYAVAQTFLEESLAIARAIDDRQRIASALQPLGMAALGRGDIAGAQRYLSEALSMARAIGNPREIAAALNALAQLHRVTGDLDAAEPLYCQVQEITSALGDPESLAIALLNRAMVAIARGAAADGRALLLETLHILDDLGSRPIGQSLIEVSAGLAALEEAWARCARYFGLSEAHGQRTGIHRDPADEAFLAPRVQLAHAALGDAAFAADEASGRALSYEDGIEDLRRWLEGGTRASGPRAGAA
jgi:predicted ATPase/class 3 adenylate cyclase